MDQVSELRTLVAAFVPSGKAQTQREKRGNWPGPARSAFPKDEFPKRDRGFGGILTFKVKRHKEEDRFLPKNPDFRVLIRR